MSTHATTTTAVDDALNTYFNKDFVDNLSWELQYQKFTKDGDIPGGEGNVIRFFDVAPPRNVGYSGAGSSTITEGSTTANEITAITTTGTDLTMAEFGEFYVETELYKKAAMPTALQKIKARMTDGAAVSIDTYTRGFYAQSTNIVYATAAQTGGVTTGPSAATALGATTLILARKVLKDGLVRPITGVSGHPDGKYAAIISEKQELDIVTEVTTLRLYWSNCVVNVPGTMGQEKFVEGYLGVIYGVAVYTTQNHATTSYTVSVDIGFVVGADAVLAATIAQMKPQIIVNDRNSPYKNVNTVAWHAYYQAKLHSSTRLVKIYSLT